jgi:hypothetical protein
MRNRNGCLCGIYLQRMMIDDDETILIILLRIFFGEEYA